MPCLNPIHIKEPSHTFLNWCGIQDPTSLKAYDVPCGKCAWCLKQKQNSYYLRCLHEYNNCNLNALFVTLTYDNQHIPFSEKCVKDYVFERNPICPNEFIDHQLPEYRYITHWYKPHVQKFLKSLNEKLIYFIGTEILGLKRLHTLNGRRCITEEWTNYLSSSPRPLKYLVTCERGKADVYVSDSGKTRFGTARPHYHAILFLNDIRLYQYHHDIINFIKSLWSYGHTYSVTISNPKNTSLNPDRTPEQCIHYVTKYICKDIADDSLNMPFADYKNKRNCEPFVLISKFLGSTLLENLDDSSVLSLIKDGYTTNLNGKELSINIPQYNIRRKTTKIHRIEKPKGYIFSANRHNPDLDVYYYPDSSSGFYFLTSDDLTSLTPKTKKEYVNITEKLPFWYTLQKENRNRKADFFATLLLTLQNQKPSSLWNTSGTLLSNRNIIDDYNILDSVHPDDIYNFILNDLYVYDDNSTYPDTLYQCYNILRCYLSSLSKYDLDHHSIKYKTNLDKSIVLKPSLFEIHPL